jgi:predicted small secreted protein
MEPFPATGVAAEQEEHIMIQRLIGIAIVAAALGTAACNTVKGAATDVNSVANCTQNTMNGRNC